MFKAVITCPATGEAVDTGFTFGDKAAFENPTNNSLVTVSAVPTAATATPGTRMAPS
jgi:hypothetical protein